MTSTQVPTAKSLRFETDGQEYMAGDDRTYWVHSRGYVIGMVDRTYLTSAKIDGEPTLGWGFSGDDGRWGEGRTRAAAVLAAYETPADPRQAACAEAGVTWAWLTETMTDAEADAWLGLAG